MRVKQFLASLLVLVSAFSLANEPKPNRRKTKPPSMRFLLSISCLEIKGSMHLLKCVKPCFLTTAKRLSTT